VFINTVSTNKVYLRNWLMLYRERKLFGTRDPSDNMKYKWISYQQAYEMIRDFSSGLLSKFPTVSNERSTQLAKTNRICSSEKHNWYLRH
jgi:hypothetical protein